MQCIEDDANKTCINKMARLVRDLSKNFGKDVEFIVSGEDTELDRNIVEQIDEPFIHLIKYAIDHGIESVSERRKNSKQAKGTINLEAYHRGGSVYIKVSDDGRRNNKTAYDFLLLLTE